MITGNFLISSEIKYLPLLSPAETMIVLLGLDADLNSLVKCTFMDLVLKKVLSIEDVQRQYSPSERVRTYKYIAKGERFSTYQPLRHEVVFMDAFADARNKMLLFRNMIHLTYENISSAGSYRSQVLKNPVMLRYFRQNIFQKMNGGFSITAEGEVFRKEVISEFKHATEDIKRYILAEPEKAATAVNQIGGNIFLFKDIEFGLFHTFDYELHLEMLHNGQFYDE